MYILLLATAAQAYGYVNLYGPDTFECVRDYGKCKLFPLKWMTLHYSDWVEIENDFPGDELACAAMMYATFDNGAGYLKYDGESFPKTCQLWTVRDCLEHDVAPEECEEPEAITYKEFRDWQEGFPPEGYFGEDYGEEEFGTTPPDVVCEDDYDIRFGPYLRGSCDNLREWAVRGREEYAVGMCGREGPATFCRETCCCLLGLDCNDCHCAEEEEEADRRRLVDRRMA